MDVELYVYDLSGGLARQYSQTLTGVQIDAIYHTAIVLNHVEYFFGQGIHRKIPGSTHHGRPIRIIRLGRTELPLDLVEEYIQSLESIYTPESYDLFLHNCNNFTQDLSVFLVGKGIPDEIRSLPETFLRSPIGQMLRGQIDQSMRTMTQAPDAVAGTAAKIKPTTNGTVPPPSSKPVFINGKPPKHNPGHVYNITDNAALSKLLQQASSSCAIIFFTSATSPPCKIVYPAYDELAHDAGDKAIFIKVDISQAYDIASRYSIRATPTFMTFLKGQKDDTWAGANEAKLRGNVQLLLQMAHPGHAHSRLNLPSFHRVVETPIVYTKLPPLDKLLAKLGVFALDAAIKSLVSYIRVRESKGMASARIPDLHALSDYVSSTYTQIPLPTRFTLVDLLRTAAADPRVSAFFAAESDLKTLRTLTRGVEWGSAPYQLRLVTCQFLCNLFGSPVFQEELCGSNAKGNSNGARNGSDNAGNILDILNSLSDCLIPSSSALVAAAAPAQQAAAALYFNLAALNHNERIHGRPDILTIGEDVEAALAGAICRCLDDMTTSTSTGTVANAGTSVASEGSSEKPGKAEETLKSLLMVLGMMLYGSGSPTTRSDTEDGSSSGGSASASANAELWELCAAMDIRRELERTEKSGVFSRSKTVPGLGGLVAEVGRELLGKG